MCFFLLIIFSDLHKQVRKSLLPSDVRHLLSVTNQPSPQTLESSKKELHHSRMDQSLQCRLFTCLLMMSLTQPQQRHLPTWTQQLCCREPCQRSESIRLWTRSPRARDCSTRPS